MPIFKRLTRPCVPALPGNETGLTGTPGKWRLLVFVFAALMAAPGQVFSRLDLLDRMSGDAYEGYERTIDVHVRNLRAKIEPDAKHPRYIETVYGLGYRFSIDKTGGL
mgnify:CR=1 FL=1